MRSVRSWFKKQSSAEHRKAGRVESPPVVAYYWDGSVPAAHKIKNISSTGFYLLTRERWHPGTLVTMTLQKSDTSDATPGTEHYISVLSKVIRLDEDGVGFVFVPVESRVSGSTPPPRSKPAGKKALQRFLEQLNVGQDCVMIGFDHRTGEEMLLGQNTGLKVPGDNSMGRLRDESGQSLVIAALCMTCLMGFVALAADVGIMLHEKRLMQTAADSAAIAGASELGFADVTTAAQTASGLNGFATTTSGVAVTVNNPPLNGPYATSLTKANYVEVIVSQSQPTFFMRLFGRNSMNVFARAVATVASSRSCMYLLGPAGTDILMTGTGSLHVPSCGILVDSNNSTGAITDSGTGSITAQSIGIVANAPGVNNSGTGHVNAPPNSPPVTGIAPVSDPLAAIVQPTVPSSCISFSNSGTNPVSLSPGCYSKLSITGTGAVTLSSGLYVLNGPVTLTGTGSITGNNVTLYVTSAAGAVSITGTQPVNLSAPTSGIYNGILFFQQRGDTNPFTVTGTGNLTFTGIFYVPSAPVVLTGTGNATYNAAFVTRQLKDTGTGDVTLTNFALTNSSTPLTAVRLVE